VVARVCMRELMYAARVIAVKASLAEAAPGMLPLVVRVRCVTLCA
jgi:hypothetical protein